MQANLLIIVALILTTTTATSHDSYILSSRFKITISRRQDEIGSWTALLVSSKKEEKNCSLINTQTAYPSKYRRHRVSAVALSRLAPQLKKTHPRYFWRYCAVSLPILAGSL